MTKLLKELKDYFEEQNVLTEQEEYLLEQIKKSEEPRMFNN